MFGGSIPVSWSSRWSLALPGGARPSSGWPVLVALHGFGDDGEILARRLVGLDDAPYARLFPDGPFPVDRRDAKPPRIGRTWYAYDGGQPAFLEALAFASAHVERALEIAADEHALDRSRSVLLGYSQGGYVAGVAAIRGASRWRGLVAIACRIKTEALADDLPRARGFPVLVLHGRDDDGVALDRQLAAAHVLEEHGLAVEVHVHDGGHGLRRSLTPRIDAFVRRTLSIPATA
ncbi:MAG TPA: hypothetical protein VKE69_07095 [Planctomycetota bacterium]|nr:hypothetical protein [Planctomycetota bacterium]